MYREIIDTGHHCEVVAPSLIRAVRRACEDGPSRRGEAGAAAPAGELRAVWVPDEEQEAMRDLTRARET